jgi:SAM-dependent methyltransferase
MAARETLVSVVVCRTCGLVYVNPMFTDAEKSALSPDLRRLHRSRSAEQSPDRAFRQSQRRAARWSDLVAEFVQPGQRVLEVGSGDGAVLALLAARGARPTGLDPDAEAAGTVAARLGVPVLPTTFERAELAEPVDAIAMIHLIEHLWEPVDALRKARRLLRTGGLLLLETPNILRPKVGPRRVFSLPHNYHFSPRTLCLALHRTGFSLEAVRVFRRDSFQVVARRAEVASGDDPGVEPWTRVLSAIRRHPWFYLASGQFLWRKLPYLRERLLYGGAPVLRGPELTTWLRRYQPPAPAPRLPLAARAA